MRTEPGRADRSLLDCACQAEVRISNKESLGRNLTLGKEMTEGTGVGEFEAGGLAIRGVVRAERGGMECATGEGVNRGASERNRAMAEGEENRESSKTATVNDHGDLALQRWKRSQESLPGSLRMPRHRMFSQLIVPSERIPFPG